MGRPVSTDGGRPVSVHVRLSDEEAAALDRARGGLTRVQYLRSLIAPIHVDMGGVDPSRPLGVHDVHVDPQGIYTEIGGHMVIAPTPHRHRRGEVVGQAFEKGQQVKMHACAVPGCTQVLR